MKRLGIFIMMYLLASFGVGAQGFTITGSVMDQDGSPVAGAKVSFQYPGQKNPIISTTTDEEGLWQMTIEERISGTVIFKVEAEDYPSYKMYAPLLSGAMSNINVVLFNAITYKAGEQSTIFLGSPPDPSWGRYYRLDHIDGNKLIFERELTPEFCTPYIFFAYKDLRIDLREQSKVDVERCLAVDNVEFQGSLNVWELADYMGTECWLIPDHSISMREDPFPMYVYPMHAVLYWLRSDYPYTADEVSLVFHDAESTNYHPFVEQGKHWCVHGFNLGSSHTITDYYYDGVEIVGSTRYHIFSKLYAKTGEETTLVGMFREINQKVYKYVPEQEKEYLVYDFSLQEGDDFHLESEDLHLTVTRVGHEVVNGETLKTLHLEGQKEDGEKVELDWIEGIGNKSTPVAGFDTNIDYSSWGYYTAYVLYDNTQDNNYYLPLTFGVNYNGWWGQQPQTVRQPSFEGGSKFEYELLPDPAHDCYQLHVYGDTIWSNSPNRYAYCVVEKSSSVYKVSIKYEELEPCIDGIGRYHVDLYFPFFLAEHHYVTVDNYGEHPVVVRQDIPTDYRPFIEEGKVWKVGKFNLAWDLWAIESHYFEGDTIVGGYPCKKMIEAYDVLFTGDHTESYQGAIYEDGRRVYCAWPNNDNFFLLYDFASTEGSDISFCDYEWRDPYDGQIQSKIFRQDDKFHGWTTSFAEVFMYEEEYPIPVNFEWMEGVGYQGFYNFVKTDKAGYYRELLSCTVGDEVLYYDAELAAKMPPSDPSEVKKQWLDFTHTVKTRPKAPGLTPGPSPAGEGSEGSELTGEYSLKELFVNFKPLSGPYVITICDDSGTEVYRKEVQTSNVIGLNTDISGYEKGEYTITVENNEEAYTANFSIDEEVGIGRPTPDPSRNGGEKAGAVCDLSGRKVGLTPNPSPVGEGRAGLPRGIYIHNGKKIVVK